MGIMDFMGVRKKVNVSVPRKMYWCDELRFEGYCPICNSKLRKQYAKYLILVKSGSDPEPLVSGNKGGSFCPKCPVVVLDFDIFAELASAMSSSSYSCHFGVAGIIFNGASSPDKSFLCIDDKGKAFRVVKFIQDKDSTGSPKNQQGSQRRLRREHRVKSKIGRNESCLCGSGKKYKNCCGCG